MKHPIAAALILISFTASAETLYVRPKSGEYGLEDGLSYETAFDGFSAISWNNKNETRGAVDPADTLYICGTHTESLTIGASGRSGKIIRVQGDCPQAAGVLTGQRTGKVGVTIKNRRYITISKLELHSWEKAAISVEGAEDGSAYGEYIVLDGIKAYSNGRWGDTAARDISFSNYVRRSSVVNSLLYGDGKARGVDGIILSTDVKGAGFLLSKNVIHDHEENEIDIKYHVESPAFEGRTRISNNTLYGSKESLLDIHQGSQKVDVVGNYLHSGNAGIRLIQETGATRDIRIISNIIAANDRTPLSDETPISGNVLVCNNVFAMNGDGADPSSWYVRANSPSWKIKNNIFYRNGKNINSKRRIQLEIGPRAAATVELDNNLYYNGAPGSAVVSLGEAVRSLVDLRSRTKHEKGGIEEDPGFVGGNAPDAFKLAPGSPAKRAGVNLKENCVDYFGKSRPLTPSMGPYEPSNIK